ncbi:hypothetical protein A5320_17485 [Rheinheimera sp. SA_1]|jgi:hypothetical protein|uniref:hypothetical protein n=1 Tax=Rheinheimera sp. SA_1 TaxID=1827365 RepID=UPI0007FF2835|nr:hypothetical protein [Rheinheimera sp. SA_1]OBP13712.1 hypothetical protein A5320_17485 [Rheinheimera sp. SA_1]
MNQSQFGNTAATKSVKDLLSKIYDATPRKDSVYEQAAYYFSGVEQQEIDLLQERETTLQRRLDDANKGARSKLETALQEVRQQLKEKLRQQQDNRLERIRQLKQLARQLLTLISGDTPLETRQLSARALGTIQLLSSTRGRHVAIINQRHKHAYKAILAIRLLDQLLEDQLIKNRYVLNKFNDSTQANEAGEVLYSPFLEEVQLPLVIALLLQDIGLQHPQAQHILRGEDGTLDEYRTLAPTERQQLLTVSYEQSQLYLKEGLGLDTYVGNSKAERDLFVYMEQDKQNFISHLLKSAIQPEDGIGNLLKIPQVYVSVVLPSKANYQYEQVPKVSALLKAGVTKGWYPAAIVDSLLKITGFFPQGYGITYIPKDSDKQDLDRYEYAIVNGLYPLEPEQPICRTVTRNLTYNTFGINVVVSADNNLYFQSAQQKLEKMSEERLKEILSKLVSNLEERTTMDLIPKCWHPDEFFTFLKNQNLWNRVDTIRN